MKTLMNPKIDRQTHKIDATDQVLGRLAVDIANKLRGKGKPSFTEHVDMGDYVVVLNPQKVAVTGRKLDQKVYRRHSGYLGSMKETLLKHMLRDKPNEVIRHAVLGMLPKNRLQNNWIKRLKFETSVETPKQENN